jgi:predicted NAD-dependent protein-ADP-ribosyltransferase YbiA (DUF1768 family)
MPVILTLENIDVVAFNREADDWGLLSINAATPLKMNTPAGEKSFPTAMHYYYYLKDPENTTYLQAILDCDTVAKAEKLGIEYFTELAKKDAARTNTLQTAWQKGGSDDAMDKAITAKLAQHPEVKSLLLKTEKSCLIKDTGNQEPPHQDGTWGWRKGGKISEFSPAEGAKPPGNKLGILYMIKRNEIFKADGKNDLVIENPAEYSESARKIMETKHPTSYLLDPALNLPKREAGVANSSTISKAASASDHASALYDSVKITALLVELNKTGGPWSVDTAKSTANSDQVLTDGTRNFTVEKDTISTKDADLITFKAMLTSFKMLCPNEKPKITVNNDMLKNLWETACRELSIQAEIVKEGSAPTNTSAPTPGGP